MIASHSGKALDVSDESKDNGANVLLCGYSGGANPLWKIATGR